MINMTNPLDPYALKIFHEARAHLQPPAHANSDPAAGPAVESSLPELFDDGTIGSPNKNYYPIIFDPLRPRDHLDAPLLWATPSGYESSLTPWYTIAAVNTLRLQAGRQDDVEPTWTHSFYQKLYPNEPQRFPRLPTQGFVLRFEDTLIYRNPRGTAAIPELPANVVSFDHALQLALSHVGVWRVPGKKWFQDQWPQRKALWHATPLANGAPLTPALPEIARCLAESFFGVYRPTTNPLPFRHDDDPSWRWTPGHTRARAWPLLRPLVAAPLSAPPPPILLEILYGLRHPRRWLFLPARFHHAYHFCLTTPAGARLQGTLFSPPTEVSVTPTSGTLTWHAVDQFDARGTFTTSVLRINYSNIHIDNLCVVPPLAPPIHPFDSHGHAHNSSAFLPESYPFVHTFSADPITHPAEPSTSPLPPARRPSRADAPAESAASSDWSFLDSIP